MKFLSKRIKATLFVVVTVLFALTLLLMNSSKVYCAPSSGGMSVNEQTEKGKKTFFSDTVQPRWFSKGELIYYVDEDYSFIPVLDDESFANEKEKALSPVDPKYSSASGGTVTVSPGILNDERYFLYATDSTGTKKKLMPVKADDAWTNEIAESSVTITFNYVRTWSGKLDFNGDNRRLKNLENGLAIPDCNTTVGKGKILYRTEKTTDLLNDAAWDYIDLEDEKTLVFDEPTQIMICIIYEIHERGNIFQNAYHHCIAQYCLQVATR